MINIETFQKQLPERFKRRRHVSREVLLCEELDAEGQPFALHYFATPDSLQEIEEHLDEFQDEIFGRDYYESKADLRWNHYLYFITEENELSSVIGQDKKAKIERNRNYARKFVFSPKQFADAVAHQKLALSASAGAQSDNVLGRWAKKLIDSQLDLVLDQKGLAETIRLIGDGSVSAGQGKTPVSRKKSVHQPLSQGFLTALEIKNFRDHPSRTVFHNLGEFNIIVGGNGVGKTTFLEAIEYLYCEDNARVSPLQNVDIRGVISGNDGSFDVKSGAANEELNARNLKWYGIRDLRKSSLANSFARYNFLNTDEAALLAKDPRVDFDDLLSRLVSGPQAADLWGHIGKLIDPLDAEISRTRARLEKWNAEKATAQEQLANALAAPSDADHALSAFIEDLRRLSWSRPFGDAKQVDINLAELRLVFARTREIADAPWLPATVDSIWLRSHSIKMQMLFSEIKTLISQLSEKNSLIEKINTTLSSTRHRQDLAENLSNVSKLGILSLRDGLIEITHSIETIRSVVSSMNLPYVARQAEKISFDAPSIDEELSTLLEKETTALENVERTEEEINQLRKSKEKSESLLQEIRQLALNLVSHKDNLDHCPVCQSKFAVSELRQRIEQTITVASEHALDTLTSSLHVLKEQHLGYEMKRSIVEEIRDFALKVSIDIKSISVAKALFLLNEKLEKLEKLESQQKELQEQLVILDGAGYSEVRIDALLAQASLAELEFKDSESLVSEITKLELEASELENSLTTAVFSLETLQQQVREVGGLLLGKVEQIPADKLFFLVQQRVSQVERAVERLIEISSYFQFADDSPIDLLCEQLNTAINAAEKYLATSANGRRLQGIEQSASERLTEINKELHKDGLALQRLEHAREVFEDIRVNDSLLAASEKELDEACKITAAIFGSIHSPNEYGVQRGLEKPLFRLEDKKAVSMKEVSTGQRAAFVLSLFLAMNAKLQDGPKVILFDDPIAHIDDLNALSFLDHLRHLVLTGQRQIFYATADTRMAGLIEHKFGFLGKKFKRIDLIR